jgi:CDP-diacylglycerol pyrophosphatase
MCKERHYWAWVFPGLMVAVLGVFGYQISQSAISANSANEKAEQFEIHIAKEHGEVSAALSKQNQQLNDNWEAGQRQITGLRSDIARLELAIRDGDKNIAEQLKTNQELLIKFLSEKH